MRTTCESLNFEVLSQLGEIHSLVDVLRLRAQHQGDQRAFVFLEDRGRRERGLTYGELHRTTESVAGHLEAQAEAGDRVVLFYPPGLDYIVAFLACLRAGLVAVPLYPPRANQRLDRLSGVLTSCDARLALTTEQLRPRIAEFFPSSGELPLFATDQLPEGKRPSAPLPKPDDLAFLQYTSGSTGTPKGVMVSHGNLMANQATLTLAFATRPEDVTVNWLPLYHDMGLIGTVLNPLYQGYLSVVMPSVSFIRDPLSWLELISHYRATVAGGPCFGYAQCVSRSVPERLAALDLSCWRVAFNGAETVRAQTLDDFAATFAPAGFSAQAAYPCYGMAEATLMISGGRPGQGATVLDLDREALTRGLAEARDPGGTGSLPVVGCGIRHDDGRLEIVDPETGRIQPDRHIGEIWVSGGHVAQGYWGRPELTQATFRARLAQEDALFLRTGDLGFKDGDQLYITGRIKDLIIIRGRNHHPADIEYTAAASHPALAVNGGAAFSLLEDGEERLVLVQEIARGEQRGLDHEAVIAAVRAAVAAEHELQLYAVALLAPGALPKTTSGKIKRYAAREGYRAGCLNLLCDSVLGAVAGERVLLDRETLLATQPERRSELLAAWLRDRAARLLRVDPDDLASERTLTSFGLDSLGAVALQHGLETELGLVLPMTRLLEGNSIAAITAAALTEKETTPPKPAAAPASTFPLSHNQQALWFLYQLAPKSSAYNLAHAVRIPSELDADRLRRALEQIVRRHAPLRTTYHQDGERIWQQVHEHGELPFQVVDATAWDPGRIETYLEQQAHSPFDLGARPPLDIRLLRLATGGHILYINLHHIAADFWSFLILLDELGRCYAEQGRDLAALTTSYADFVARARQLPAMDEGKRLRDWWKKHLAGAPMVLDLPSDRPRPKRQTFNGAAIPLHVQADLAASLRQLARARETTLYTLLLSAFQVLLQRYTGQHDFVIGSPTLGRDRADLDGLIGYFVNPVCLRADLSGSPDFDTLLDRNRREVLAVLAHAAYPFSLLVEELQPQRDPSRSPLFQVMFAMQRAHQHLDAAAFSLGRDGSRLALGGLELESMAREHKAAQFDLTLQAAETETGLLAAFEYNTDLFDGATIQRLAANFEVLLATLAASPESKLAALHLLSGEEEALLLSWSGTSGPSPGTSIQRRFESHAQREPEKVALVFGQQTLTYGDLDRRANRLAAVLRERGVGTEQVVAVCLERSPDLIVALLAVLKAGAAYLPMDPDYPPRRLAQMSAEATPVALIMPPEQALKLGLDIPLIDPRALPSAETSCDSAEVHPEQLAYVLYTSGSSGTPKGVAVRHGAVAQMIDWAGTVFPAHAWHGTLASTSVNFDLSVFEIFGPLCHGGTLILVKDVLQLAARPMHRAVTMINTVPSAMAELLRLKAVPETAAFINLAGEALSRQIVDALHALPQVDLVTNLYGPSEDTTYSTYAVLPASLRESPSIGQPITNTRAFILNKDLRLQPASVPGELCLAGAGLARGYYHQAALTSAAFVPDPFAAEPGGRLYKTGDLVRWSADGMLTFLGRLDHQVKLRGFRIELAEIEAVLDRYPGIDRSLVLVREDRDPRLTAYLTASRHLDPAELRPYLADLLPGYMIPSAFVTLERFPLTPNGKIDRAALPVPDYARTQRPYLAPRSATEQRLCAEWQDLLALPRVGLEDDFFELGGHSLLATRLVARIRESFGVDVPVAALFEQPTVAGLAAHIDAAESVDDEPRLAPVDRGPDTSLPLSFVQEGFWLAQQIHAGDSRYHMPAALSFSGSLDVPALEATLRRMVNRHEVLRTNYREHSGRPVAVILAEARFQLPLIDLSGSADPDELAGTLIEGQVRNKVFDLAEGPLLRFVLIRLAPERHILLLVMHHIVTDAWSIAILSRELNTLYEARLRGTDPLLPAVTIQYADYAVWQRHWCEGPAAATQLAWWQKQLADLPPVLRLPPDKGSFDTRDYRPGTSRISLSAELRSRLEALTLASSSTLFMTLLAAFKLLIARHTGAEDVIIGVTSAGRGHARTENTVGCFLNVLPLRSAFTGNPSFAELLASVRQTTLATFARGDLPFDKLIHELPGKREAEMPPVFDILFNMVNTPRVGLDLPGLKIRFEPMAEQDAKYAMTLFGLESEAGLELRLVYRAALYSQARMDGFMDQFRHLLEQLAPEQRIRHLSLISPTAAALLPDPSRPMPAKPFPPVIRIFLQIAARFPDRPALIRHGKTRSYGQLLADSEAVARLLADRSGQVVALHGSRCFGLVAGLLGIFRAGCTLLTLDPSLPAARKRAVLSQAGAACLLCIDGQAPETDLPVLTLDANGGPLQAVPCSDAPIPERSANPAYIFFTSGTTGTPKAIAGNHLGLAHFIDWQRNCYRIDEGDRVAWITGLSFDAVLRDLFLPLCSGAALCIPQEDDLLVGRRILTWLADAKVSVVHTVPSVAGFWLDDVPPGLDLPDLRYLFLSGEPLTATLVARLRASLGVHAALVNFYGPTETTMIKTAWTVPDEPEKGIQPVGFPLPGAQALVLTPEGLLAAAGEPGEIALRTPYRTNGYLNDPAASARRFVQNPFSDEAGDLVYRTGDRGRYRADGTLEILGRLDDQVKIRGIRIEPAEVAAVLASHEALGRATVIAGVDKHGEKRLLAYYTTTDAAPEVDALRQFMAERLPDAMVPSDFVYLEAMPLLPNGKIDRAALPEPTPDKLSASAYCAPRCELEAVIVAVFSEVLKLERVGIHDNFFRIGGHSLIATQVVSRLRERVDVTLHLRDIFAATTPAELSELMRRRQETETAASVERVDMGPVVGEPALAETEPIRPLERAGRVCGESAAEEPPAIVLDLPLSFAQQRFWILHHLEGVDNTTYNLFLALRFEGPLDVALLARSFSELMRRHEILRTTYHEQAGRPRLAVHAPQPLAIPVRDLSDLAVEAREARALELAAEEQTSPFDLSRDWPLRLSLLKLGAEDAVLLLTKHHIASDGWSFAVLYRELVAIYHAFVLGEASPLAELEIQYADFAAWQRERLQGAYLERLRSFWRLELAGLPPVHELPTDRPRPYVQSDRGARVTFHIEPQLTTSLKQLGQAHGATLFMVLETAFAVLLARYSGRHDIVVGSPVANRNRTQLEGLIGCFVNTLVLRNDLSGDPSFAAMLARFKEKALNAFSHGDLPFEDLVDTLKPERSLAHAPLFQVMFAMQNPTVHAIELEGLRISQLAVPSTRSMFDLTLSINEGPDGLSGIWDYCTDLFDRATIDGTNRHFRVLLEGILAAAALPVSRLPLMAPAERIQVLDTFNRRRRPYDENQTLLDLIAHQARLQGRAPALEDAQGNALTRAQLNDRQKRLAAYLRKRGIGAGSIVAVCLPRGSEAVLFMLAVLEAGAAYLPLDPDYPVARLIHMLRDSKADLLVRAADGPAVSGVAPDELDPLHVPRELPAATGHRLSPGELAYVIYTSGSSGQPKGVMVSHANLANHACAIGEAYKLNADDRVLQFASLSFDVAGEEIYPTLAAGATLVLRPNDLHLDLTAFHAFMAQRRLTLVNLPAAFWHEWVDDLQRLPVPDSLRLVVTGSDKVSSARLAEWRRQVGDRVVCFNAYGPTEATITSTLHRTTDKPEPDEVVAIGRPVANATHYILDGNGWPLPLGIPGELCIGGRGIALGYLNRPAQTALAFVPDPHAKHRGARLYRTGDRARYRENGTVAFLGRVDDQLKIRGFRIEPGEVESVLNGHPGVAESVVLPLDVGGSTRLAAFVQAREDKALELWPSMGEYPIYDEILYHAMTGDEARNQRYLAAIGAHVRDKVVLDIGTGKDCLLARFCVAAGARKVYAVEAMAASHRLAAETIARAGFEDKIALIHGLSTEVDLPERVDVCVSEIIGTIGSSEGVISVLNDARRRFLKPGGVMIPGRCITRIAAVSLPADFVANPVFAELGADYARRIFEHLGRPHDVRLCVRNLPGDCAISGSGNFEDLDFGANVDGHFQHQVYLEIHRAARLDGFLLSLELHVAPGQVIDVLEQEYSWLPVFLPVFSPGLEVAAGDRLAITCRGEVCPNGINQDYHLEGCLLRTDGDAVHFTYSSHHLETAWRRNPFYEALADLPVRPSQRVDAGLLRHYLGERLPEYMVPAEITLVAAIPRFPGGKLDRTALTALRSNREAKTYLAPEGEIETSLAAIWAVVLGLKRVGRHDNFFALGGDSILSIQVVARAREAGLRFTPRQMFEQQTVAGLATLAVPVIAEPVTQGPVIGEVPLLPIQHRFFEEGASHHANQSLLLRVPASLSVDHLKTAIEAVFTHHDALRLRFQPREDGFLQFHGEAEEAPFQVRDLGHLAATERSAAVTEITSDLKASLNYSEGPIGHMTLLQNADAAGGGRLFFLLHHLVVDGVSWRILLDDLQTAYTQLQSGGSHALPIKTSSYQSWAERLADRAGEFEIEPWLMDDPPPFLEPDYPVGAETGSQASTQTLSLELDQATTHSLLRDVPAAYHTRIDDVLLTALARACDLETLFIELEGHGRETFRDDIDLSRTVGWFTCIYPVLLKTAAGPGASLKAVKEQLRALPNPLAYGCLRYLHPDADVRDRMAALPRPRVVYNYLGQTGTVLAREGLFGPAPEPTGPDHDPNGRRGHQLEIVGMVREDRLCLRFCFSNQVFRAETIAALVQRYKQELEALIAHCLAPESGGFTPSDFPLADIDQQRLDDLLAGEPVVDLYCLTPMQEGMHFHALHDRGGQYFGQTSLDLIGAFEPESFIRAWGEACNRHQPLAASFHWQNLDRPLQMIRRGVKPPINQIDWSGLSEAEQERRLQTFLAEDKTHGFLLDRAPLMRLSLIQLGPDQRKLIWSYHHLLLDGWSVPKLFREVLALYEDFRLGRVPEPSRAGSFRDYIAWLRDQDPLASRAFWLAHLAGFESPAPLPRIGAVAHIEGPSHGQVRAALSKQKTEALQGLARDFQVTVNILVQAAWSLLLGRYCRQDDLVFGVVVSGRGGELAGMSHMIGMFINTLPARVQLTHHARIRDWLRQQHAAQVAREAFAYTPLVDIKSWSQVRGSQALFESLLAFENYPMEAISLPGGLEIRGVQTLEETHYPLALVAVPGQELTLTLHHAFSLVDERAAHRLLGHLTCLLNDMVQRPDGRLGDLEMLTPEERSALLTEAAAPGPVPDAGLHELFQAWAARRPNAPALAFGGEVMSYAQLEQKAERLAAVLQERGVGLDVPVAIFLERTPDLIVSILAILKAGGCYLPMDLTYPEERLAFMLKDTVAPLVLTRPYLAERLPKGDAHLLDVADPGRTSRARTVYLGREFAGSLAYIIYTSGSTGRPKGVGVTHAGLANLSAEFIRHGEIDRNSRILQFASSGFDASVLEMLMAFGAGACLQLAPLEEMMPGDPLAKLLRRERITHLIMAPTALAQLPPGDYPDLHCLVAGGETCPRGLAATWSEGRLFINAYGPTEATVATTLEIVTPDGRDPSIGRPLAHMRVHLLDRRGQLVPVGVPGELCIAAPGLARGYLGRPATTAAVFVPDPFASVKGSRLYRSGDLAAWRPSGKLDYLGRIDHQVKLRGFRIELGEIEANLRQVEAVRGASVLMHQHGGSDEPRLVAYLLADEDKVNSDDLRAILRKNLPEHMIPAAFLFLECYPLTSSGKVDRQAMAALTTEDDSQTYLAPRNDTEARIAAILARVLGIERISVDVSFFDMGGHSLMATRVISELRREFETELPLAGLFEDPTVTALAQLVETARWADGEQGDGEFTAELEELEI